MGCGLALADLTDATKMKKVKKREYFIMSFEASLPAKVQMFTFSAAT